MKHRICGTDEEGSPRSAIEGEAGSWRNQLISLLVLFALVMAVVGLNIISVHLFGETECTKCASVDEKGGSSKGIVSASRIFAGPNEYPPKEFAAYGILAFRSRPSPYDRERHLMFCNAYVAILPHASELEVLPSKQMVTVWPLSSHDASDRLNRLRNHTKDICQIAVDDYGLVTAQRALKDAELTGRTLSRAGPFLLAWSPSADKGKQDALVLVSDLSDITTYEQAHEIFLAWSRDIESDPALWMSGWNIERSRTYIRSWVDKYGEKSLAAFAR